MRSLCLLLPLAILLSCKDEPQITPDALISLEYGNLFGFTGAVTRLTVYPQKQVFQPYNRLAKPCEEVVTASEWNDLTQLFDEKAFKKIKKVEGPPTCADGGGTWIIARSTNGEIRAEWDGCVGGDMKSVKPLMDALASRMQRIQATCQ